MVCIHSEPLPACRLPTRLLHRAVVAALVAILCLLVLAPARAETVLRFRYWGDVKEIEIIQDVIRRFEAAHPGVHVSAERAPAGNAYVQKVLVEFAGGTPPDVLFVETNIFVTLAQKGGLLPLNQMSMELHDRVAIHEYEGIAADDNLGERERIVRDLGDRPCLILRNHGLLTIGRTVGEAFYWMYYLEQSCRIQVAAQSTGAPLALPPPEMVRRVREQAADSPVKGWLPWQALKRKMDREQPGYRD